MKKFFINFDMNSKRNIVSILAKKTAEHTLRRDANQTTCVAIYQPKAPAALSLFKKSK